MNEVTVKPLESILATVRRSMDRGKHQWVVLYGENELGDDAARAAVLAAIKAEGLHVASWPDARSGREYVFCPDRASAERFAKQHDGGAVHE